MRATVTSARRLKEDGNQAPSGTGSRYHDVRQNACEWASWQSQQGLPIRRPFYSGGTSLDRDLFMALIDGTVGSLIGMVATFVVLYLTLRADRKKSDKEREVARQLEVKRSVREYAVDVASQCHRVRMDGPTERSIDDLVHSLTLLAARIGGDFPRAAKWCEFQAREIESCFAPGEDLRALQWQCGYVFSALTRWIGSDFDESKVRFSHQGKKTDWDEKLPGVRDDVNKIMDEVILNMRAKHLLPTQANFLAVWRELTGDESA